MYIAAEYIYVYIYKSTVKIGLLMLVTKATSFDSPTTLAKQTAEPSTCLTITMIFLCYPRILLPLLSFLYIQLDK